MGDHKTFLKVMGYSINQENFNDINQINSIVREEYDEKLIESQSLIEKLNQQNCNNENQIKSLIKEKDKLIGYHNEEKILLNN